MGVNKVVFGGETLIDLTNDKVTPETLADGVTAHDASGEEITGTMKTSIDSLEASNVIFDETVYTSYEVGKIKLTNGKAVLINKGENLLQVMRNIWEEDIYPKTVQPRVTMTLYEAGEYEVGSIVAPTYRASFSKGSYSYDTDTGVKTKGSWTITDTDGNEVTDVTAGSLVVDKKPYFFTVGDDTEYTMFASVKHTAGIVPQTNMGNPYPAGQIQSGTKSGTSNAVTGYRNSFYGVLNDKNAITESNIRAICETLTASGKALKNGDSFTISIPKSTDDVPIYGVFIAYPDKDAEGNEIKELASVLDYNDSNNNILGAFGELGVPEIIDIEGANNYDAIPYKVYIQYFAQPYNANNTYTVKIKGDNE